MFHLHGADQPRCPQFRELVSGQRVISQIAEPFLRMLHHLFFVINRYFLISARADRLKPHPAHNRSGTSPARNPFVRNDAGIEYQVLPRRSDTDLAVFLYSAVLHPHLIIQSRLRLRRLHAPDILRVMKNHFLILNLNPAWFFASPRQNQRIQPRFFQVISEMPSAIGGCDISCLRRQRGYVEPAGAGRAGTGQRSGCNDQEIFL